MSLSRKGCLTQATSSGLDSTSASFLPSHYKGRTSKRCAPILTQSSSACPFLSLWGQWKHHSPLGPKTLTCHFLIPSPQEPELNLLIKTTACPSSSTGAGFAVASEGTPRGCVTAPAWGRVTVVRDQGPGWGSFLPWLWAELLVYLKMPHLVLSCRHDVEEDGSFFSFGWSEEKGRLCSVPQNTRSP